MRRQSDLVDIYGVKRMKSSALDRNDDSAETGFRHSDAFHCYFRGYTEIRNVKPNGKLDIKRFYTQPWIVNTASDRVYWRNRFMYLLLTAMSAFFCFWSMSRDLGSNRMWYIAIPEVLTVVLLILLTAVLIHFLFMPRRMTLWNYESGAKRLKTICPLASAAMLLTAVSKLTYLLLCGAAPYGELLSIGSMLLAASCTAAIWHLEKKAAYITVENNVVLPEGEAYEIW